MRNINSVEIEMRLREPSNSERSCKVMVLEAADAINDMRRELEYWRDAAAYLASCHAATAEYDGQLSGISKSRKNRYASICETAVAMMQGQWHKKCDTTTERAKERCAEIAEKMRWGEKR